MTLRKTNASELAIPARYYLRVSEVLLQSGVDIHSLLQPLGLNLQTLAQPGGSLTLAQIDQLVQSGIAQTGRQDLGFELGRILKLSSHDIVGFGILSSPTVDYALRLVSRFFRLVLPAFQMRYHCDEHRMQVSFQAIAPMSPLCLAVHIEALATATHFELADLIQSRLPDYQMTLAMEQPPHSARYAQLHGARLAFVPHAAPQVCLKFPASLAQRKLALADESALRMAEARCREMVRKVVGQRDVAGWVRMMLNEGGHGLPSLENLAHTLNMSMRTLDRHLKREGTGYRELWQQARLDRARDMLRNSDLSITAIAHELGYTDAANFTRAFRRASGVPPSVFRDAPAHTIDPG